MATQSTVHFTSSSFGSHHIVYVHHDGYPEHRGAQIMELLTACKDEMHDARFEDAGIIAARFVGYMLNKYHEMNLKYGQTHPLGAISVRLVNDDPGGINYRYVVRCDNIEADGLLEVTYTEIPWDDNVEEVSCNLKTSLTSK